MKTEWKIVALVAGLTIYAMSPAIACQLSPCAPIPTPCECRDSQCAEMWSWPLPSCWDPRSRQLWCGRVCRGLVPMAA